MNQGSHGLGELYLQNMLLDKYQGQNSNNFIIKRQTTQFKNGQKCFGQKYCGFKKFSESDLRGTD